LNKIQQLAVHLLRNLRVDQELLYVLLQHRRLRGLCLLLLLLQLLLLEEPHRAGFLSGGRRTNHIAGEPICVHSGRLIPKIDTQHFFVEGWLL